MKDVSSVEWFKDNKRIDLAPSGSHMANCEYCEQPEDDKDDEEEDSRFIFHPNNSITIERVKEEDVGAYTCRVITGVGDGEPLGIIALWHLYF